MDLGRAFTFVFDDRIWVNKLTIIAGLGIVAVLLMPLLGLGLLLVAVLLGYLLELVANMKKGDKTPLPAWTNYEGKFGTGGALLTAVIVYNLPNVLLVICFLSAPGILADPQLGISTTFVSLFCIIPALLVYTLVAWSFLAAGAIQYSTAPRTSIFFEFSALYATIRDNFSEFAQWATLSAIVNLFLLGMLLLPCIGWLIVLMFTIPTQGFLLGQLAVAVEKNVQQKKSPRAIPAKRRL